jgi:hypothetical protein
MQVHSARVGPTRLISRIGALSLAGLLAGCYGCTLIGCNNRLSFDPGMDLLPGVAYEVEACLDDRCEEGVLQASGPPIDKAGLHGNLSLWADTDLVEFMLGDGDFGGSHHITFSLRNADGKTLATFDQTIELTKYEPNGGWPCGPTCWSADIDV